MNDKNQQLKDQLQQELDTVKVPDYLRGHIRQKIEQEMQTKEAHRSLMFNNRNKKRVYFTSAVAAAALLMTIGSGYTSPTMANVLSRVPVVGVMYEDVSVDFGLKAAQEKGISQGFKQAVTDNKIEMSITDVYYDGQTFSIGYRLVNKGEDTWGEDLKGWDMDFKAKGVELGQSQASAMMQKVKDNEFEGVILIDADHFEEGFILELNINKINGQKGSWDFTIPVTSEFLKGTIHTFAPDYKTEGLGADITIKELTFTPSGIRLIAETISEKGTGNNYGFNIKGVGSSLSGGGSGDFGSEHGKNGKDHIIHRVSMNPVAEVPNEVTIVIYDLNNEINGTNHQLEFTVPLKNK
jgi:hypothetical protein